MIIESAAEDSYPRRHLAVKAVGAAAAIGAALAAPLLTVPGSVLMIGLLLAALVGQGVLLEHRMYARAK